MLEVRELTENNYTDWDLVVTESRAGTIFHTDKWIRILERSLGLQVTRLAAVEDGKVVGVFPVAFNKNPKQWVLSKRSPLMAASPPMRKENPYGGPVALPGRSDVIVRLVKYVLRRHRAVEIVFSPDPLEPNRQYSDTLNFGSAFSSKSTFLIDLKPTENLIWKNCKGSMRTHVRKARRLGVKFVSSNKLSDLEDFYNLLQRTYSRSGFSPLSRRFYSDIFTSLNDARRARLFFSEIDGKRITSDISLIFKGRIYAWSGGSDENYWSYSPNNLLSWEIMMWAKQKGISIYDLCGVGTPSLSKFKESLGGKLYRYPYIKRNSAIGSYIGLTKFFRRVYTMIR